MLKEDNWGWKFRCGLIVENVCPGCKIALKYLTQFLAWEEPTHTQLAYYHQQNTLSHVMFFKITEIHKM